MVARQGIEALLPNCGNAPDIVFPVKVDLHLHSKYSDRPSEWILRRLGVPQSYSEPEMLYQKLHAAGMDLKTITDHNRLDGVLQIAEHPDVFLSEEVTTYFPDGCKVHVLVWNLREEQHTEIQKLRANIYELSGYLRAQNLPHAVTHALTSLNGLLTVDHFEKLILLFKGFEGWNGNREPLAQEVARAILEGLTPPLVEAMANRQNLAPTHAAPHRKILTGGSDDHSGLYVGVTYTETTGGPKEFFDHLLIGEARGSGRVGDPLRLSSGIYNLVFAYARDKIKGKAPLGAALLAKMAERFVAGQNPTAFSFGEKLGLAAEAIRSGQAFEFIKPGETTLSVEISNFLNDPKLQKVIEGIIAAEPNAERRSFRIVTHLTNQLSYRLATQFLKRVEKGQLMDALQSFTGLLPVGAVLLPYLVAFRQQAADRGLLLQVAERSGKVRLPTLEKKKKAWFTDTLEDVNGVARTISAMTRAAKKAGAELTVVTSRSVITIDDIPLKNFAPVGEFEIPEYELQKLSFPPLLEMVDYVQREGFTELIISTPGPIGLCALAAGRLLGLQMSGIYHTDFPQYARFLSDDALMESMVWNYMQWFYGQMDRVYVNSEFYRACWIARGIAPEKLEILPRGLDTELFNPKHHQPEYWKKKGAEGAVLLYVGRISKEKELNFLAEVMQALEKEGAPCTLALVGEGPYRAELQQLLPRAIFTGILAGQELGVAYASADLLVFPSTTDTFGNVVLEALAAGLPVAVSDAGGPKELVKSPDQGKILKARDKESWVGGLREMIGPRPLRAERLALAKLVQDERSWDNAFTKFWK
jgi:glycosyltransferase involved in cell wall biosynthesis